MIAYNSNESGGREVYVQAFVPDHVPAARIGKWQISTGTLALAGAVLLIATILAGYAPAMRASRIDPLAALRHSKTG